MSLNLPMFASRNRAFRELFAAGEQGVWFDPSDFGTMFQDSAGTTPVTAIGQPVGKILDKSGRGNHATQSTNTKRPTLQQDTSGAYYLLFDGADDALVTGSVDFTGTDKVSIFSGLRKANDSVAIVAELGSNSATVPNTFTVVSGTSNGFSWGSVSRGNAAYNGTGQRAGVTVAAPDLAVITATHDIPGDLSRLRRNGTYGTDGTADKGTGTFGNYPLYIGGRGGTSFYFNGRIYGLIIRGAESTAAQITAAEYRMNNLTRAY